MKILVIEDEPAQAQLIRYAFSELGEEYQITIAYTLKQSIAYFKREEFDVVLLDLNLPDASGLETLKKLIEIEINTPIVILSTLHDEQLALEAVRNGAQDFVLKDQVFGAQLNGKMLIGRIKYAIERFEQSRDLEMRIETLAHLDPLTGLMNRKGMQQVLARGVHYLRRATSASAIVLDLDDFDGINEQFGHAIGDLALQEIARLLREVARSADHIARIDSDEYMVLTLHTQTEDALRLSERIRLAIQERPMVLTGNKQIALTATIAVVEISPKRASLNEVLEDAHRLFRKSRNLGQTGVVCSAEHVRDEDMLPSAIEKLRSGKYFQTVKQPIFDLKTEKIMGYEFLSRSTVEGFETPDHFFNLGMEANILNLIDHHCLKNAISVSYGVDANLCRHLNLFPSSLINTPPSTLERLLPPFNLAGSYCLEISEQQILNPTYLVESVQLLKNQGVKVAMDDVGAGRTCLESLLMLEPDVIKIDKKMVMGVHKSEPTRKSLKRLMSLLAPLEAEIVAEGIESREDMEVLVGMGISYGQGFFWGRPA